MKRIAMAVGLVAVSCGAKGSGPSERTREAEMQTDVARRSGAAIDVAVRGPDSDTLVFRKFTPCSEDEFLMAFSPAGGTWKATDLARFASLGFKRVECESGGVVAGFDPASKPQNEEFRRASVRLLKKSLGEGIAVASAGADDTTLLISSPGCSDHLLGELASGKFTGSFSGSKSWAAIGWKQFACVSDSGAKASIDIDASGK